MSHEHAEVSEEEEEKNDMPLERLCDVALRNEPAVKRLLIFFGTRSFPGENETRAVRNGSWR